MHMNITAVIYPGSWYLHAANLHKCVSMHVCEYVSLSLIARSVRLLVMYMCVCGRNWAR